jgi:hypothetical protein
MRGAWAALSRDLAMAVDPVAADVAQCHTWYTHLAGLLVRRAYGIPLVVTVHSLEPLRPAGSASSSAAATTSRPGWSGRRWNRPMR